MTTRAELLWREIQGIKGRALSAQQVQVINTAPESGGLLVAGTDGDVPVSHLGSYNPAVGDTAWMLVTGMGPVLIGATRAELPPSPNGTIVSAPPGGATTVAVTVDGTVESLPWLASYTPAAGHLVRIDWQPVTGGGWSGCVLGKIGTVAAPKEPPPKEIVETSGSSGAAQSGTTILRAIEVGTWRSGGWRSDVGTRTRAELVLSTWTSQPPSTPVWYYGPIPAELQGVTVKSARFFIPNNEGGPFAATPIPLYLHSHQRKHNALPPRAASPFASPAVGENANHWASGPGLVAAVQQIIDGDYAGVMAYSTNRQHYTTIGGLIGKGRNPMTGAIEIDWERGPA